MSELSDTTKQFRDRLSVAINGQEFFGSLRAGNIKIEYENRLLTLEQIATLFHVPMSFLTGLWVDQDQSPTKVVITAVQAYSASTQLTVDAPMPNGGTKVFMLSEFLSWFNVDPEHWAFIVTTVAPEQGLRVNLAKLKNTLQPILGETRYKDTCQTMGILP
jgi:hypothetical protein